MGKRRALLTCWLAFGAALLIVAAWLWNFAIVCRMASSDIDGSNSNGVETETNTETVLRVAFFADPQIEGRDRVIQEGYYGLSPSLFFPRRRGMRLCRDPLL